MVEGKLQKRVVLYTKKGDHVHIRKIDNNCQKNMKIGKLLNNHVNYVPLFIGNVNCIGTN